MLLPPILLLLSISVNVAILLHEFAPNWFPTTRPLHQTPESRADQNDINKQASTIKPYGRFLQCLLRAVDVVVVVRQFMLGAGMTKTG